VATCTTAWEKAIKSRIHYLRVAVSLAAWRRVSSFPMGERVEATNQDPEGNRARAAHIREGRRLALESGSEIIS
jgi:hypothetical protein